MWGLWFSERFELAEETLSSFDAWFNGHKESLLDKCSNTLDELKALLGEKNKAYGNSVCEPIRVFSKSDPIEQVRVRIDDKLKRIQNGNTDEDTVMDLMGYLVVYRVLTSE